VSRFRSTPEMKHALERLAAEGIPHKQTSEFQIKVGPFNFYPDKGTIYMDRDPEARSERGLEDFLALTAKVRGRNSSAFKSTAIRKSPPNRVRGFDLSDAISGD
jgi:hypothetical protein